MPSRIVLGLHALLALLGLTVFLSTLYWACLSSLDAAMDELHVIALSAALGAVTVTATALVTPWLLDRLLRVEWIKLDEAGDVGPHLRAVLETWHLPSPWLGVVMDDDPCALTYGLTRRSARLLVTSGLLKTLDVDQQCAIVTHEAGHLASGDFPVATLFAGPILILTQLRGLFDGRGARFGATASAPAGVDVFTNGGFLLPLVGVLVRVYTFFYAGFSQHREQWADAFARAASPVGTLQDALLVVLDRLARPGGASRHGLAIAARGFTPVDAWTAGRLGTAAAWAGTLERQALLDTARVVEANPASELAQQTSLHPPPAERLPGGANAAARLSLFTLARLFSAWLAAIGFTAGFCVSILVGGWFGLPLILWGVGRLIWLVFHHGRVHGKVENEVALHDVLEKFAAEPARAYQTRVRGRLVGKGVPGQTWCPDMVLGVGDVYVAVRPRTILGRMRPSSSEPVTALGDAPCVVEGILRMYDVPYLELHALDADSDPPRRLWRSHFVWMYVGISVFILVMGVLLMAPQWMDI